MRTTTIIENFINGNLTEARKMAARSKMTTLYRCCRKEFNKSHKAAFAIAQYLKGKITFQQCSDDEIAAAANDRRFSSQQD